jgi:nucleotide-binding universal stress UspA family protein
MYKHILIATDGSDLADKAVRHGVALAKALNARVTIITATEPWTATMAGDVAFSFPIGEYDKAQAQHAKAILELAMKMADASGLAANTIHVKDQYPAEAIVDAAAKNTCDLIVMASHGRRGVTRLLLGSQANRVVTQSTLPVLVVR